MGMLDFFKVSNGIANNIRFESDNLGTGLYSGHVGASRLPEGHGVFINSLEIEYDGEWQHGKLCGFGRKYAKGYYVIGRITCFKDGYYAQDHTSSAICMKADGKPFLHNSTYWPSAYARDVWQFNVELAKESVRKFGLDEINFDYVRFPDKLISLDDQIDYRNRYGEDMPDEVARLLAQAKRSCEEQQATQP